MHQSFLLFEQETEIDEEANGEQYNNNSHQNKLLRNNDEIYGKEKMASGELAIELEQGMQLLQLAKEEVGYFLSSFEGSSSSSSSSSNEKQKERLKGFQEIEISIINLIAKLEETIQFHREKQAKYESHQLRMEEFLAYASSLTGAESSPTKALEKETDPVKRLFLTEVSILLVLPYLHRLLSADDLRKKKTKTTTNNNNNNIREGILELSYYDIDPIYTVRYTGVSLAALLRGVERDLKFGCLLWRRKLPSSRQNDQAKILASRLFGAYSCLEMIINLGGQVDDDLILERAVGCRSELEVPGIQENACIYNRASAERNLARFTGYILTANAVVEKGFYKKHLLTRLVYWQVYGVYYNLPWNWEEALHRGQVCYAGNREEIKGKIDFAKFVWDLPETPLVRYFYKLGLPRIKLDKVIYLPKVDDLEGGEVEVMGRIISNKVSHSELNARFALHQTPNEPLLYSHPALIPAETFGNGDVLLIHFHGGGFISLSSFAHENYTRHWARDCQPIGAIVSIDYRLAPANKFPIAFNDALRGYYYAVEKARLVLGFEPRKVLVVGDSAGGNLACAVTTFTISSGYSHPPDGMLLCYPAVDSRRLFSPSLLFSVNERIIPFTFLECCLAAYLDGDLSKAAESSKDLRVSPALAPDDVLRKLPKTRIVVGDVDPLYDQCVRYAHHLGRLNVDVKLKVYEGMPHGFLSFAWPVLGVPEVKTCIDDCTAILREMSM